MTAPVRTHAVAAWPRSCSIDRWYAHAVGKTNVATTSSGLLASLDVGDRPVVFVDLDALDDDPGISDNGGRTTVIVVWSADAECTVPTWADVAITGLARPARPWVGVGGRAEGVAELESAVSEHQQAATVAVQALRTGERLDASRALMVESMAYGLLQMGDDHRGWLRRHHGRHPADLMTEGTDVLLERTLDELTITFNRPNRANAFRAETRDALLEGLELASLDTSIAVVHLRGRGSTFSSGGDLAEFGTVADGAVGHLIRSRHNPVRVLARLLDRSVAHVQGRCIGAGVELSAACGKVLAAADTTFALPEVSMGLLPGAGGTWSVPRRIGRKRMTWLTLTGRTIDVGTAQDWGLVDAVESADA